MFDEPVSGASSRYNAGWQTRIKAVFDGYITQLSRLINPEADTNDIIFSVVDECENSLGLKATVAQNTVFCKVYDGAGTKVPAHYAREKNALLMLRDSGLAVHPLAFNDELRFLLTRYEKRKLEETEFFEPIHLETLQYVGEWIADLDAALPKQTAYGTWYTYLKNFGDDLNQQVVYEAREDLSAVPILGTALARNNPVLTDFVFDNKGGLRGRNFEAARMRPLGWDYVLTSLAVSEKYGGEAAVALEALSAGFEHRHKGALLADELNTIARVLFCARATAMCDRRDGEEG